jgi:hypothetical protein
MAFSSYWELSRTRKGSLKPAPKAGQIQNKYIIFSPTGKRLNPAHNQISMQLPLAIAGKWATINRCLGILYSLP